MADLHSLFRLVSLKIRSRSPKSNQLFPPSQQCNYPSFVKIHPLVQKKQKRKQSYGDAGAEGMGGGDIKTVIMIVT